MTQKKLNRKLREACIHGNFGEVEQCIEDGADINDTDEYGFTPLHWAAYHGYEDEVKLLIKKGANLYAKTKSGGSVLQGLWAHPEVARIIRKAMEAA